jgi:hypothetical protein
MKQSEETKSSIAQCAANNGGKAKSKQEDPTPSQCHMLEVGSTLPV